MQILQKANVSHEEVTPTNPTPHKKQIILFLLLEWSSVLGYDTTLCLRRSFSQFLQVIGRTVLQMKSRL
jgi:hypothetical protein